MAPTVWTSRRKWAGNLIPIAFWLPAVALGLVLMVRSQEIVGPGLWLLLAGTVLGWLAVNQFGLFQNANMKRQLRLILEAKGESAEDGPFVGIATPHYSSTIDPHEDVGFLRLYADRISFVSETRTLDLAKSDLKTVRYRANVHSLLGLGRWVSLEGVNDGKAFRLLIEPRERPTLLGNLRYSKLLADRLRRWLRA